MKLSTVVSIGLAILASAQAQDGSQTQTTTQDASQTGNAEAPTPTVEYLDVAGAKTPMATPNVTVSPTRQDPQATEPPTPEPTYLPTPAPTPAPIPAPAPWVTVLIDHDAVQPFPQLEPVTISEKAGVKFKPQIHITNGCHPYPADSPSTGFGYRHDREHVIVWIDNPDVANPKILAVTPSAHSGYSKQAPPNADCVDGTSAKVSYVSHWPINHALEATSEGGEFQDLIMWDQLTEDARRALISVLWGDANTPMNDGNFVPKLEKAWPF